MVYIVLGVVAFLCFAFCIYMLVKVEHEPVKKHKPAWQDDDADEEKEKINYRSSRRIRNVEDKSTPWRDSSQNFEDILPEEEEETTESVYDLSEKKKDQPVPK